MKRNGQMGFNFGKPIIDPEGARQAAEDGMYRAEFLTDLDRKIEMLQAVRIVAERNLYFTADQVWDVLGEVGDERDDGSGLGPVLRMAFTSGIMEHTGSFRKSQRAPTHGRPLTLWKSRIYLGSVAMSS
jgi:hypothetical protein